MGGSNSRSPCSPLHWCNSDLSSPTQTCEFECYNAAGIALVLLIKILDLTVKTGTCNCLILKSG